MIEVFDHIMEFVKTKLPDGVQLLDYLDSVRYGAMQNAVTYSIDFSPNMDVTPT